MSSSRAKVLNRQITVPLETNVLKFYVSYLVKCNCMRQQLYY